MAYNIPDPDPEGYQILNNQIELVSNLSLPKKKISQVVIKKSPIDYKNFIEDSFIIPELSGFNVIKILGQGSFGITFLVQNKESNVLMVMKIINSEHYAKKEIDCLKRVNDLGICGKDYPCYLGDFELKWGKNDLYVILTDYEDGYITLFDFYQSIQNEPKEYKDQIVENMANQIIKLENNLIKNGIQHNDIHSKNIIVHPKQLKIKIIDFGLCTYR